MTITAFTNVLLDGRCHADIVPILFGGSLITLKKKSGGVKPIAIGYTWRRLTATYANSYVISELADLFSPIQLGVVMPGGCEARRQEVR